MNDKEKHEFERIRLVEETEFARMLIAQYTEHQQYQRDKVEGNLHRLGVLDERLGEAA